MRVGLNVIEWPPRSDGELPAASREKRLAAYPSDLCVLLCVLLSEFERVRQPVGPARASGVPVFRDCNCLFPSSFRALDPRGA